MLAGAMMAGCTADGPDAAPGSVRLSVGLDASTRAATAYTGACDVTVAEAGGRIVGRYASTSEIPSELVLAGGDYRVTATVGRSLPASWTERYYCGEAAFTVSAAAATEVAVACRVVNSAVAVTYDPEVDDVLHDYTLTVANGSDELVYTGHDARTGYFITTAARPDLQWTLAGTTDTGAPFTKTGTLRDVAPATLYTLHISFHGTVEPMGGALVDITVDTAESEIPLSLAVCNPPVIALAGGGDIDTPVAVDPSNPADLIVTVATAGSQLARLSAACSHFGSFELPQSVDFVAAAADVKAAFLLKGVKSSVRNGADSSTAAINFSRFFLSTLPPGTTKIEIEAVDAAGLARRATVSLIVTEQ